MSDGPKGNFEARNNHKSQSKTLASLVYWSEVRSPKFVLRKKSPEEKPAAGTFGIHSSVVDRKASNPSYSDGMRAKSFLLIEKNIQNKIGTLK